MRTRPPSIDDLLERERSSMGRECKLVNAHVFADKDEHVFFFVYDCAMDPSPLVKKYRRFAVYVNDKQLYSGIIPEPSEFERKSE